MSRFSRAGALALAASVAAALAVVVPSAVGSVGAATRGQPGPRLQAASAVSRVPQGGIGVAAEHALRDGPLPADATALARAKKAAAKWSAAEPSGRSSRLAPTAARSFQGLNDPNVTPSDSTSAIGTKRFVHLVNDKAGIYSRTGNTPLASGTLINLTGAGATDSVFDPQIIWDGQTKRFYYAADDVVDATHNFVALGFSKTATPASVTSADWCQYVVGYGSDFPDYPKLGDSKNFWLVGVNVFTGKTFTGSDIFGIGKPPAGTACPAASSFAFGIQTDLKTKSGATAFTPVPAQQTDTNKTGFAVARPASIPGAGATSLTVYKVTKKADGTPKIAPTFDVAVPAYNIPAAAPQSGATQVIDTSDTRNTQAVSAIDPGHGGAVGLWTQHTVLGGAGAEVRWYEIDPAAGTLLQSGSVTSASLFEFNGAIGPDRHVNGATKLFGDSMVMVFSSSSSTTDAAIWMVSKIGAGAQSAPVLILTSPGPDKDFACATSGSQCRWGDYAAATPDPASPTGGTHGQVWLTNQWNINSTSTAQSNWRTQNIVAQP